MSAELKNDWKMACSALAKIEDSLNPCNASCACAADNIGFSRKKLPTLRESTTIIDFNVAHLRHHLVSETADALESRQKSEYERIESKKRVYYHQVKRTRVQALWLVMGRLYTACACVRLDYR